MKTDATCHFASTKKKERFARGKKKEQPYKKLSLSINIV